MSVSCVMTEDNESQYFVFYFHNPHYKRMTSSWIWTACTQTYTQRCTHSWELHGFHAKFSHNTEQNKYFLSSLHLLLSTLRVISSVSSCLFASASESSFMFVCLCRPSMQMSEVNRRVWLCVCMPRLVYVCVMYPCGFYFWQVKHRWSVALR